MDSKDYYVLITGVSGQLGYDINIELQNRNIKTLAVSSKDLDLTNENMVKELFAKNAFTHVIHCAAYTKVDLAEDEKDIVNDVNVNGTKYLAYECEKLNIPLMFFSTDYVFEGVGCKPYKVYDQQNPKGQYAISKYNAEKIVEKINKFFIIRISWVFGMNGNNFVKTMLKLSESKTELNIVCDQVGSPTYTKDLSKLACDIIFTKEYGIYHATNEGYVSWSDFAREIFKLINKDIKVNDVSTEEYGAKAPRPKNSRLDKSKLLNKGFYLLPTWQDALYRYLKEIGRI